MDKALVIALIGCAIGVTIFYAETPFAGGQLLSILLALAAIAVAVRIGRKEGFR